MADIRINSLPTTASASSSDDFLALDGATNGTRKLSAYSPTFGGNLTVSGTGTSSFGGLVKATGNAATSFGVEIVNSAGAAGTAQHYLTAGNGAGFTAFRLLRGNGAAGYEDNGFNADCWTGARFNLNALGGSGGNFTISGGNLTVSGRDLTLGSSESVIYFGTPSANYLYYNGSSLFLRVASVDRITIPASTGNVLIGTTTDGGQKLQVSGTAYVSGNFTTAGYLGKTNAAATGGQFLSVTGSTTGYQFAAVQNTGGYLNFGIESSAGGSVVSGAAAYSSWIGSFTNTPFYVCSNSAIALTLDSSQAATFAGTITGNKGSVINAVSGVPALRLEGTGAANSNYGLRINAGLSASDYGLFVVDDTSTDAYFIVRGDGTAKFWKNTEVAGALAIGNTVQTAAAVASTHKVTISIGGTTYYLLATNV